MITSIEDQQKFIVPTNRNTELLYYNQRIILDNKVVNREPRTWQITKVNGLANFGTTMVTLGQSFFDVHKDFIEKDEDGNVIGFWADYYDSEITPEDSGGDEPITTIYSEVSYSGVKAEIKIGGSYKKFTVKFYNQDGTDAPFQEGSWSYTVDGTDVSDQITVSTTGLNENEVKIKFAKNNDYIAKVLTVAYTSLDGITSSVPVEILTL